MTDLLKAAKLILQEADNGKAAIRNDYVGKLRAAIAQAEAQRESPILTDAEMIEKASKLTPEQAKLIEGTVERLRKRVQEAEAKAMQDEANRLIAEEKAQPAQEPIIYQIRSCPEGNPEFFDSWRTSSKEEVEDCEKTPILHGWVYQTRRLYTHPAPMQAEAQPAMELVGYWNGKETAMFLQEGPLPNAEFHIPLYTHPTETGRWSGEEEHKSNTPKYTKQEIAQFPPVPNYKVTQCPPGPEPKQLTANSTELVRMLKGGPDLTINQTRTDNMQQHVPMDMSFEERVHEISKRNRK